MIPTSLGALAALRVPMTGASGGGLAYCSAPASPAGRDVTLTLRSPMGSDPGSGDERGDLSNLHSRLLKSFEARACYSAPVSPAGSWDRKPVGGVWDLEDDLDLDSELGCYEDPSYFQHASPSGTPRKAMALPAPRFHLPPPGQQQVQHAQPAPPFAPELGGEGLALPASPLAYQRAPVSAPAAGYGAAFAVPEPVMDGVLGSRSAGVEASKLSGSEEAARRSLNSSDRDSGLAPRTPAQSAVRSPSPERRPRVTTSAVVPPLKQLEEVAAAVAPSHQDQPSGLQSQRSNTPGQVTPRYGRMEFAAGPFASGSAVTPFVGTVDAAATALQPLALHEVDEHTEDASAAASAASVVGSLGSQPAGQPVQQPTHPRESAAKRRQLDAPARSAGGGTPPELRLPAAWQSPAPASPPQPFASEPMLSAGEPAEAQQWQQLPMPGLVGQGLHAAASAQLVRERGSAAGADGPMAPQSSLPVAGSAAALEAAIRRRQVAREAAAAQRATAAQRRASGAVSTSPQRNPTRFSPSGSPSRPSPRSSPSSSRRGSAARLSPKPSPKPSPRLPAWSSPGSTASGWHSCSEGSDAQSVPPIGVVKVITPPDSANRVISQLVDQYASQTGALLARAKEAQADPQRGSVGSVSVGSGGRASPPPLSRFAVGPQAVATTSRPTPPQVSPLQMKQAAAEAPPEVLASPRPKQRALWRFRSGGQPAQYVPPADPVVKAAAAAPDRSSPKAAQQPSPKASLLSRKWSPPAPLIAPQPPSPAAGDVPKSPSALDNGDSAAPLTHRRSRTLNPFKTRAFAAAAAGFADIAAAHAPKPSRQPLPPPPAETPRQTSAPLPRAVVSQRSPAKLRATAAPAVRPNFAARLEQVAVAVKRSKAAAAQDSPAEQHPGDSGENGEATPLAVDEAAPVVDGPAASARPAPAVPVPAPVAGPPVKTVLVAAVALINDAGEVLLAQRPPGRAMAGLWEFPGGKLEPGEAPEGALCRELHEELGIGVAPGDLRPLTFASHAYDDFHLIMPVFKCDKWAGTPTPLEGQQLAWARAADLEAFPMPPADVPLLPAVRAAMVAAARMRSSRSAPSVKAAPVAEAEPEASSSTGKRLGRRRSLKKA